MSTALDASVAKPQKGGPSFPLRQRLYRAAWCLTWLLLAAWTPPPLRSWRVLLVRLFGGRVHPTAMIYGSARIWYPPNLQMAEYACLGRQANCYSMGLISIGPYAVVSQGAFLCGGTHDIADQDFQLVIRPIEIGTRAWIAADAFVGPGVIVGNGAVLGARAVAFGSLKPWTVYSGNPAVAVKARPRPAT